MISDKKTISVILFFFVILPLMVVIPLCLKKCSGNSRMRHAVSMKKPDPSLCVHPDGIDLSHHNKAYDWKKVDAKFVYVRATFSNSIKDNRYDIHRKAALRHKIPVGAYHFLVADVDVKEQFDFFASVVAKEHISLRPMLDIEESKYWRAPKGFSDRDAHGFIRKWCDLCKQRYGKAPIIYTTEKLYQRYSLDKGFEDCLWWVANYNNIYHYEKSCVIPYTIHQYSDKKYVEGFYGYVDCNRFRNGKTVKDIRL